MERESKRSAVADDDAVLVDGAFSAVEVDAQPYPHVVMHPFRGGFLQRVREQVLLLRKVSRVHASGSHHVYG
jgi:hypothetical protein